MQARAHDGRRRDRAERAGKGSVYGAAAVTRSEGKNTFAPISARSRPSGINLVTPRPRLHVLLLPLEACVQRKQFFDATRCCQFGMDSGRALGNWALEANATWLRLIERCPGLGHARFAEAGPPDLKWRCSSTSLRLLPRIVLRVDVGKSPGTVGTDLYNRLFFHEDIVRHAWRKGVETARGQGLRLARIGGLSDPHAEGPGDHRDDLIDRMLMRSNAIARGELEPKHKIAFLVRIAKQDCCLRSGREHGWGRPPLDVLR